MLLHLMLSACSFDFGEYGQWMNGMNKCTFQCFCFSPSGDLFAWCNGEAVHIAHASSDFTKGPFTSHVRDA